MTESPLNAPLVGDRNRSGHPLLLSLEKGKISSSHPCHLIACLNAVRLNEEELSKTLAAARSAQIEGKTDCWTGIITTIRLFKASPDKAKAIIFRLQALTAMIERDELGDWIRGYGTSILPTIVLKALLSAAADHPLSIINGDVSFERESFLRRVLELAEPLSNDSG
jgi:hypothetical protein